MQRLGLGKMSLRGRQEPSHEVCHTLCFSHGKEPVMGFKQES